MASEDPRDGLGVLSLIDSLDVQMLDKPEEPRGLVEGVYVKLCMNKMGIHCNLEIQFSQKSMHLCT